MRSFHTKIVGVTFANQDGSNRQWIITRCHVGEQLVLSRDPANAFDANAIRVCRMTGEQLGHLSRELAASLAPDMDEGKRFVAQISNLTGGVAGKPTRGVNLLIEYYVAEMGHAEARTPSPRTQPPRPPDPKPSMSLAGRISPGESSTASEARPRQRRLSLTKTQRASVAGAELLALCETITADGRIDDEEIADLQQWLVDHVAEDLPAIGFLTTTVERILADGAVTPEEREELYGAIERVLPPEIRKQAVEARRAPRDRDGNEDADALAPSTPPVPPVKRVSVAPIHQFGSETPTQAALPVAARGTGIVALLRRMLGL